MNNNNYNNKYNESSNNYPNLDDNDKSNFIKSTQYYSNYTNNPNSNDVSPSNVIGKIMDNQTHKFAESVVNQASKDINSGFLDNLTCNPSFLKVYFDIETEEIKQRLLLSLNPFNKSFLEIIKNLKKVLT